MTLAQAGKAVGVSRATVHRYEGKQGAVKWLVVEALCKAYGVPAKERRALVDLAKSATVRGWWDNYADTIPHRITPLFMLEDEAVAESHWTTTFVPGLLQTRQYAAEVIRVVEQLDDPEEIERKVNVRMKRQDVLARTRRPLQLSVVMDEAVVRRAVGSPAVMAEQLQHLVKSSGPQLELQILPLAAGTHPADSPSFMILRGQDQTLDVVHMSHMTGALFLETEAELDAHRKLFRRLQEQALDTTASLDLLSHTIEQLTSRT